MIIHKAFIKRSETVLTAYNRGSNPHKSYDDPSDPLDIISIRLLKESGSKVDSVHVHKDVVRDRNVNKRQVSANG